MSELKYCQGPDCHTYYTQDRLKGIKGDTRCQNDWLSTNIVRALNHFGRLKEVQHLTEDNAWIKDYDYNYRDQTNPKSNYRFINKITKEVRPLTEAQYNDNNYTLNER
jgi:hypothetical protein